MTAAVEVGFQVYTCTWEFACDKGFCRGSISQTRRHKRTQKWSRRPHKATAIQNYLPKKTGGFALLSLSNCLSVSVVPFSTSLFFPCLLSASVPFLPCWISLTAGMSDKRATMKAFRSVNWLRSKRAILCAASKWLVVAGQCSDCCASSDGITPCKQCEKFLATARVFLAFSGCHCGPQLTVPFVTNQGSSLKEFFSQGQSVDSAVP